MDEKILCYAGLTSQQITQYRQIEDSLGEKVLPLAEDYFYGKYGHISEIYEPLRQLAPSEPELLAAILIVVLRCSELRADALEGRKKALFLESLIDISRKVNECVAYKKTFGIFVMNWYDGLIKNWRPILGRLQYEVGVYDGEDIRVGDFVLQKGDKKLQCHIPSGLGPLTKQACLDSLKRAWEEFPEFRKDGYLPVLCHSWLFYPPYEAVFGPDTGVGMFRSLWHYYASSDHETFLDCWRVFSMDLPEDPAQLPQNTRMQRSFVRYIQSGGTFGDACGILLFDGQHII